MYCLAVHDGGRAARVACLTLEAHAAAGAKAAGLAAWSVERLAGSGKGGEGVRLQRLNRKAGLAAWSIERLVGSGKREEGGGG